MLDWIFGAVFAAFCVALVWVLFFRGERVGAMRCKPFGPSGNGGTARVSVRRAGSESGGPTVLVGVGVSFAARVSLLSSADAIELAEILEAAVARIRSS